MKLIILLLTVLVGFVHCRPVYSADWTWTKEDTWRQVAVHVLQYADYRQTRYIESHPDEFYEVNPLIGEHPDLNDVNRYFMWSALIKLGVAITLPAPYREWWQWGNIGSSATLIIHNHGLGIRMEF